MHSCLSASFLTRYHNIPLKFFSDNLKLGTSPLHTHTHTHIGQQQQQQQRSKTNIQGLQQAKVDTVKLGREGTAKIKETRTAATRNEIVLRSAADELLKLQVRHLLNFS